MRQGTIPPNWTDIVQLITKNDTPDNIEIKDNRFNPTLEEDPRKNTRHEPIVTPDNKINRFTSLPSKLNVN